MNYLVFKLLLFFFFLLFPPVPTFRSHNFLNCKCSRREVTGTQKVLIAIYSVIDWRIIIYYLNFLIFPAKQLKFLFSFPNNFTFCLIPGIKCFQATEFQSFFFFRFRKFLLSLFFRFSLFLIYFAFFCLNLNSNFHSNFVSNVSEGFQSLRPMTSSRFILFPDLINSAACTMPQSSRRCGVRFIFNNDNNNNTLSGYKCSFCCHFSFHYIYSHLRLYHLPTSCFCLINIKTH